MLVFKKESELIRFIIRNRKRYFDFELIQTEKHFEGGRIDLIGEDEDTEYLVEIKRDIVTKKTVSQVQSYLSSYKSKKKVVGIAVAPEVSPQLKISNSQIRVLKISDAIFSPYINEPYEIPVVQPNEIMEHKAGEE